MVAEIACCTVATAAKRAARRWSSATSSVVNELHRDGTGDDSAFHTLVQKEADGGASALAVIERPIVDVHADEGVGLSAIETAREAHRVVERVLPVVEAVGDARAQVAGHFFLQLPRHVLPDDVAAEWERKTRLVEPPGAHVGDEVKPFVHVGELALVAQSSRIGLVMDDGSFDLIERNDDRDEIGLE